MVTGMATTKITITLPDGQLDEIRRRVAAKESASISGYIQQAVRKSIENAAAFREMVSQSLIETGGPVTAKERSWARNALTPRKTARRRKVA